MLLLALMATLHHVVSTAPVAAWDDSSTAQLDQSAPATDDLSDRVEDVSDPLWPTSPTTVHDVPVISTDHTNRNTDPNTGIEMNEDIQDTRADSSSSSKRVSPPESNVDAAAPAPAAPIPPRKRDPPAAPELPATPPSPAPRKPAQPPRPNAAPRQPVVTPVAPALTPKPAVVPPKAATTPATAGEGTVPSSGGTGTTESTGSTDGAGAGKGSNVPGSTGPTTGTGSTTGSSAGSGSASGAGATPVAAGPVSPTGVSGGGQSSSTNGTTGGTHDQRRGDSELSTGGLTIPLVAIGAAVITALAGVVVVMKKTSLCGLRDTQAYAAVSTTDGDLPMTATRSLSQEAQGWNDGWGNEDHDEWGAQTATDKA